MRLGEGFDREEIEVLGKYTEELVHVHQFTVMSFYYAFLFQPQGLLRT